MTPTVLNTNIGEVEIKMPDNSKHNTTQEFKLANKNLAARLKQADLVNKTGFDQLILILDQEILPRIPDVPTVYFEQLI